MIRLMAAGDAEFLARRVKCPSFMAAWERTRRRLVRLYLHELAADFVRLHRQARAMVAQSPEHFSDLVPILFRQQWAFWRALLWIEARLTLAGLGVPKMRIPKLSPDGLLGPLEAMQRAIAQPGAPA